MTTSAPAGCARCGTILDPHFRFCPECGLPPSGEGVLSTQIEDLRRRLESETAVPAEPAWRRALVPVLATAMLTFVLGLGVVLFNRTLLDRVFPPAATQTTTAVLPAPLRLEPEWVRVPAGTFPFGDPSEARRGRVPYEFQISKYEVTNAMWASYLQAEEAQLRQGELFQEDFPGERAEWSRDPGVRPWFEPSKAKLPVRNVTAIAAARFCRWLTGRLASASHDIRLPTRMEWEYAARGNDPARDYRWGSAFLVPPLGTGGQGLVRKGIFNGPFPVDDPELARDDTSACGAVAMGTNVSEWVLLIQPVEAKNADYEFEPLSPAELSSARIADTLRERADVHVCRSGASFADSADSGARLARVWSHVQTDLRGRLPQVGLRLVKVRAP